LKIIFLIENDTNENFKWHIKNILNQYNNSIKNDLGNEITIKPNKNQIIDSYINNNNNLSNKNKDFIGIKNLGAT